MGNIIISNDMVSVTDSMVTVRSEAAGYPKSGMLDRLHMMRHFRADDVTANDWLFKLDLGSAQPVAAIMLNNVNFNKIRIEGNATDAWGAPSFTSGDLTVGRDIIVNRNKVFILLTACNYRYLRGFIPDGATESGTSISKWMLSTLVVLESIITLDVNIHYGYSRTSTQKFADKSLPHGGFERVGLGDDLAWVGTLPFGNRALADMDELWEINALDNALPLVFYENNSDTSRAYLCIRDDAFSMSWDAPNVVSVDSIRLKELI